MCNIHELIPQRPPIVMVDEFLGIKDGVSSTCFTIREGNIFVDDTLFSECGLIEHIAQSAAARVGYIFRSNNQTVPIGYIGSINDFHINVQPKVGDTIKTSISIIQEVFNITLIQANCYLHDEEIASCKMKIYLDSQ